jgi:imidazolonepropionase-like amidohydrolase
MRRLFALFALSAWLFAAASAEASDPPTTAYVHGRWWNGSSFVEGARYVRGQTFTPRPQGRPDRTVDLAGAYVTPPYADAHNHMPGATPDVSNRAIAAGVFYLMNPTVLASVGANTPRELEGPGKIDAVLSMGAITAPGGHPEALYVDVLRPRVYPNMTPGDFLGDAYHYVTSIADIAPVLDRLVAQHAQFVKVMVLFSEEYARRKDDPAFRGFKGVDPTLVAPLVAAAHARGLRVAVHIETAADFRVITAAGADEAAHMPGYWDPTGPLDAYRITDTDAAAAARAHMVVVPTASLALRRDEDAARRAAVQDMQRTNLLALKRAHVPLLIGTDQQPGDAPDEAAYLIGLGVLTPREALNALTEATPRYIFPDRRIGRLEPGYEASFLVLAGDPIRDFAASQAILRRVKQGYEIPDPPPELRPHLKTLPPTASGGRR